MNVAEQEAAQIRHRNYRVGFWRQSRRQASRKSSTSTSFGVDPPDERICPHPQPPKKLTQQRLRIAAMSILSDGTPY